MLQYLLDTDHLTLLEQNHLPLVNRLAQQARGTVGISAITVQEALRGRLGYLSQATTGGARVRGYGLLVGTVQLCSQMPIAQYDVAAEAEYQHLRGQRLRVGTQDLKVAAVTLVNRLVLLTRNQRDFGQVPGLSLADWSA